MKKFLASLGTFAMFLLMAMPVLAVKPTDNLAAAKHVEWNLSGDVMPVPPYGSADIEGSDELSKLIVNQPNGRTETAMSGIMKGLNPDTQYTVYLSRGYTPYVENGWNVTGTYTVNLTIGETPYTEYLVLTQSGNEIGGSLALDLAQTQSVWNIDSGTVNGNEVEIFAHFGTNTNMKLVMNGTIAEDGSMSGTWHDIDWNTRSGNWSTTAGHATMTHTGSTGWPGLFTSTIPTFTFMTDAMGEATWHLNLRDENFPSGPGSYDMSVWINGGGKTILVSDVFTVVVD